MLRQGLLAALLGTAAFFALLDALLRLCGYGPDDMPYGYDPCLVGDFQPAKRHIAHHPPPADHTPYRFDTNKQGLRADQDFTIPKPMDIHRLLLLGDSFTFGPFVNNHELTSAQLQTLLNKKNPVAPIEVVNAAMSGWTLIDQFEYLREKGLRLQPDLVAISFYINDIREFHPFFRTTLSRQAYREQSQTPLYKLRLSLRRYSAPSSPYPKAITPSRPIGARKTRPPPTHCCNNCEPPSESRATTCSNPTPCCLFCAKL